MRRWSRMRRAVRRNLRRTLEVLLLVVSVVAGLGIIGSCATAGNAESVGLSGLFAVVGAVFALILVGTVFLFTTMSRDLRLLRERFAEDETPGVQGPPRQDASPQKSTDAGV